MATYMRAQARCVCELTHGCLPGAPIRIGVALDIPAEEFERLCPLKAADLLVREWLAHKDEFLKFKEEHFATHT